MIPPPEPSEAVPPSAGAPPSPGFAPPNPGFAPPYPGRDQADPAAAPGPGVDGAGYPPGGYPPPQYAPPQYQPPQYPQSGYPPTAHPAPGTQPPQYPQNQYPPTAYPAPGVPPAGYPAAGYPGYTPAPAPGRRRGPLIAAAVLGVAALALMGLILGLTGFLGGSDGEPRAGAPVTATGPAGPGNPADPAEPADPGNPAGPALPAEPAAPPTLLTPVPAEDSEAFCRHLGQLPINQPPAPGASTELVKSHLEAIRLAGLAAPDAVQDAFATILDAYDGFLLAIETGQADAYTGFSGPSLTAAWDAIDTAGKELCG